MQFFLQYPSPACCAAVITHSLLPLSLLHSRQTVLGLYFQVTFCDKLYEVCSRSTDTIAFIALAVTLHFLILFIKGEKSHLLALNSHPSAEPVNWILHATAFTFAAAFCYLSEKDAGKEQGPLCVTIVLKVIWC